MKNIKSLILIFSVILLMMTACTNTGRAQATYTANSSKTTTNLFKGAIVADSISRLAVHDTVLPSWYPSRFQEGSVVYNNSDSSCYFYDGNKWWLASPRRTYYVTATLDFGSTTTLLSRDLTVTVTGAELGDIVSLGIPNLSLSNSCFTAFVSSANTVTVRFNNYSSGTIDPSSGTFNVLVTKIK